jgi:hypothetical protein
MISTASTFVMPGLGPGHPHLTFFAATKDVDGRNKSGHHEHLVQSRWKGVVYRLLIGMDHAFGRAFRTAGRIPRNTWLESGVQGRAAKADRVLRAARLLALVLRLTRAFIPLPEIGRAALLSN